MIMQSMRKWGISFGLLTFAICLLFAKFVDGINSEAPERLFRASALDRFADRLLWPAMLVGLAWVLLYMLRGALTRQLRAIGTQSGSWFGVLRAAAHTGTVHGLGAIGLFLFSLWTGMLGAGMMGGYGQPYLLISLVTAISAALIATPRMGNGRQGVLYAHLAVFLGYCLAYNLGLYALAHGNGSIFWTPMSFIIPTMVVMVGPTYIPELIHYLRQRRTTPFMAREVVETASRAISPPLTGVDTTV